MCARVCAYKSYTAERTHRAMERLGKKTSDTRKQTDREGEWRIEKLSRVQFNEHVFHAEMVYRISDRKTKLTSTVWYRRTRRKCELCEAGKNVCCKVLQTGFNAKT